MSEPDLTAELRRRAEESAATIMQESKAEARRILADADESIRMRQREVLRDREKAWRAGARARTAAARHDGMKEVLLARTRLVERVLEKAKGMLPDASREEAYASLLRDDLERALDFVGDRGTTVWCTPALASELREALESKPSVVVKPTEEIGSGFVAVDDAERVRVDCTLETKLARLAPVLAIEILERLPGSEP